MLTKTRAVLLQKHDKDDEDHTLLVGQPDDIDDHSIVHVQTHADAKALGHALVHTYDGVDDARVVIAQNREDDDAHCVVVAQTHDDVVARSILRCRNRSSTMHNCCVCTEIGRGCKHKYDDDDRGWTNNIRIPT